MASPEPLRTPDTERPDVDIRLVGIGHPDAQTLIARVQALYVEMYGHPDETPYEPHEFDPPFGRFFVAYRDDHPVAMGGWRFRPDVIALGGVAAVEIKRMFVDGSMRRRGLARMMLTHLERSAAADGADVIVLETGDPQVAATELYRSAGYQPVEGFGLYRNEPHTHFFGRRLDT
jgi:GNAT superfamily N-acetyltransferase